MAGGPCFRALRAGSISFWSMTRCASRSRADPHRRRAALAGEGFAGLSPLHVQRLVPNLLGIALIPDCSRCSSTTARSRRLLARTIAEMGFRSPRRYSRPPGALGFQQQVFPAQIVGTILRWRDPVSLDEREDAGLSRQARPVDWWPLNVVLRD